MTKKQVYNSPDYGVDYRKCDFLGVQMSREMYAEWVQIRREMGNKYGSAIAIPKCGGVEFCHFLKSIGVHAVVIDPVGQVKIDNPSIRPLIRKYALAEIGSELFNTNTSATTPKFINSITRECKRYGITFKMVDGCAIKLTGELENVFVSVF